MKVAIVGGARSAGSAQKSELDSFDLLIAADSGANHCRALHLIPHVVVGDLDSIDKSVSTFFRDKSEFIKFSVRKDKTDFELALELAVQRGASEICVFSWSDERIDYCLDSLFAAAALSVPVIFHESKFKLYILKPFIHPFELKGLHIGQKVSIYGLHYPLSLQTEGLEWNLSWESCSSPARSQSNEVKSEHLRVSISRGTAFFLLEEPAVSVKGAF